MEIRPNPLIARALGIFFKHLYTTLAWSYDWVAWLTSMGQWRTWQSAAVTRYPPGRVLELGHGPGHVLIDLANEGNYVLGLDPSRQMSSTTARRLRAADLPLNLVRARAETLPFKSSSMTTIVATFPTEYIFSQDTLSEIYRVLVAEGELVIIGVASITGRALYDRAAAWLYRLTGQSSEPDLEWLEPLVQHKFSATIEVVVQRRARVVRIRALKRST